MKFSKFNFFFISSGRPCLYFFRLDVISYLSPLDVYVHPWHSNVFLEETWGFRTKKSVDFETNTKTFFSVNTSLEVFAYVFNDDLFIYYQGENVELAKSSLLNILKHIEEVPEKWRNAIRNNGGG